MSVKCAHWVASPQVGAGRPFGKKACLCRRKRSLESYHSLKLDTWYIKLDGVAERVDGNSRTEPEEAECHPPRALHVCIVGQVRLEMAIEGRYIPFRETIKQKKIIISSVCKDAS